MKTQRVRFPDGKTSWVVLDDNYQPIQPITQYIRYLQNLERSPNTVSSYASHMKGKETRTRLLKLKEPKRKVQTFIQEQVKQLIDACDTTRDKFLLCLLYESGICLGQAFTSLG